MRPSIARIRAAVEQVVGVDPATLGNSYVFSRPRQVAMYLARTDAQLSLCEIGRQFGGYHHTSVIHACKVVKAKLAIDPGYAAEVGEIRKLLATGGLQANGSKGAPLVIYGSRLVYASPEFIKQLAEQVVLQLQSQGEPTPLRASSPDAGLDRSSCL
jgi:hypothetical protein